ncbi:hypothetical protein [Roseivirga misakiensis]|uniref:Uncharacterized protein n=1 Tax=Roseivirga misakiensis TaxID=1563681 RepID=A0A1E5T823_9BACT|nr:hypothetical protein [Roseivirga misakiensis]OEK07506.1 hypothetical protein BFP71_00435 [Roseivirga misakiensis]
MEKNLDGILEQVFIDQVVADLVQMKFDFSLRLKSESSESSKEWLSEKLLVIDGLIAQFDQTSLAREFSLLLNNGLDKYWTDHSILSKDEVLFCGALAIFTNTLELANFLQISVILCFEKATKISVKLNLACPNTLRDYTLAYLKKEFQPPKMLLVYSK